MTKELQSNISPVKKAVATLLFWWGVVISSLGVTGIILTFFSEDSGKENLGSAVAGLVIFAGIPLIAGYLMKKNIKTKSVKDAYNRLERNVMEAAKKHNGKLTLSDASYELKTNLDSTQELMNIFVQKNIAEIDVDENGKIIYIFNDFLK